jgi:ACS family hexuronate transporter-like MFS transporter
VLFPKLDDGPTSRSRIIAVCLLLLLASAVNYMDRQTLAVAAPRIKEEFQLTLVEYGNIEAIFGYSFAFGSLLWGFLVDRISVRWIYPIGLLGWSLMGFLTGWARGYEDLYWCRLWLGFFESAHWPCGLKTTQALLSRRGRAMGNSVLQSGTSIGAILTPWVMLAILTPQPGSWRIGFQGIAIVGASWVFLWLFVVRDRDFAIQHPGDHKSNVDGDSDPWWMALFTRQFVMVVLLVISINTMWQLVRAWLPLIMRENYGFSERQTLIFNSLWYIFTDLGCFASGVIALAMAHRGWSIKSARVLSLTLGVGLFATIATVPFLYHRVQAGKGQTEAAVVAATTEPITWAEEAQLFLQLEPMQFAMLGVLLISGAGALAMFPIYYSFAQDVSPLHPGKVTSVASMLGWIASSMAQPEFGRLTQRTGNYDLGLFIISILPVVPWIAIVFFWPNDARAAEQPTP